MVSKSNDNNNNNYRNLDKGLRKCLENYVLYDNYYFF